MEDKKKVLVVEDLRTLRESYTANLRLENYTVDAAANLKEALDAIDARTYHVAIVDVRLTEKRKGASTREGVDVVKYIRQLDEGTQTIVLSAVKDQQLERDFLKEYGVFDYITKAYLDKKVGISHLLKRVRSAIDASTVDAILSWDELVDYVDWPLGDEDFRAKCLTRLEFKGGFQTLSRSLTVACQPLKPLLRHDGDSSPLTFDSPRGIFHGKFWSKGQAMAIELFFWGKNAPAGPAALEVLSRGRSVLYSKESSGLSVAILDLPTYSRRSFLGPRRRAGRPSH